MPVPTAVRELFGRRRTLAVGASFGVIVVVGTKKSGNVEVATFRTEGPYADGRRPDHVDFSTPEEDAQRRDFTINGMFYDPIAEQGPRLRRRARQDLAAGVVRAIGNPADRMSEDKLRLLRAVRFAATLDFALDPKTAEAVRELGRARFASSARSGSRRNCGKCSSIPTAAGRWNWRRSWRCSRKSFPNWLPRSRRPAWRKRTPNGPRPCVGCSC